MGQLAFGYTCGLPEGCESAWGARAIATRRCMDFLRDRQDSFGPDKNEIVRRCNANGGALLKKAQARYRELSSLGEILGTEPNEVTLLDEDGIKMLGNTNGSCGYVYVCAFLTA